MTAADWVRAVLFLLGALGVGGSVVPYWECGKCVSCKWGKPNCCAAISVIGVHADGGMQPFFTVPTLLGCACPDVRAPCGRQVPANKLVKSEKLSLEQLALVETLCIGPAQG